MDNIFIIKDMNNEKRGSAMSSSIILNNKYEFEETLSQLRNKPNTIDHSFLTRLSHALELKHSIFSEEISSIVLVISTAAINTAKPELALQQEMHANAYLRV